jgi:hypothetical protein
MPGHDATPWRRPAATLAGDTTTTATVTAAATSATAALRAGIGDRQTERDNRRKNNDTESRAVHGRPTTQAD